MACCRVIAEMTVVAAHSLRNLPRGAEASPALLIVDGPELLALQLRIAAGR